MDNAAIVFFKGLLDRTMGNAAIAFFCFSRFATNVAVRRILETQPPQIPKANHKIHLGNAATENFKKKLWDSPWVTQLSHVF